MAKQAKTSKAKAKADVQEIPTNSKGFRKSYSAGVVGWQVYLEAMRMHVNINQYGAGISAPKALIDYTQAGFKAQRKFLADNKVKIPRKLDGRLTMAEKNNHPSFASDTADYAKSLRKLVDLYDNKHLDAKGKGMIKTACQSALKSAKAKITNRLKKRINDMV
jgi:hypothetical protein